MKRANLTEARLKKCWSQEEAAAAIGVDHLTLHRWEAGKSTPRGYNLRKLCEVYSMTAEELGFESEPESPKESTALIQTNLSHQPITQLLSAYAENQKMILRQLSEVMAYDIQAAIYELERVLLLDTPDLMAHRTALIRLLGLPALLSAADSHFLNSLSKAELFSEKESLTLYEDILVMGWDGFRRSKSRQVISRIDGYVNKLTTLSKEVPMGRREQWQSLLCRFSQLSTRIAQHTLNKERALRMATQAIDVALELEDAELIASAFYGRSRVHLEASHTAIDEKQRQKHFVLARVDVDAALVYVERVRSPLKGNIYLIAAEIYALLASHGASRYIQCEQWQDRVAELVYGGNIERMELF